MKLNVLVSEKKSGSDTDTDTKIGLWFRFLIQPKPGLGRTLVQGPLKKWTEHSLELYLLKIHNRLGSYYTTGLDEG